MKDPFSLRVFSVDYYLHSPISGLDIPVSEFRGAEIKQVPVLRIFGTTQNGQKACMHIHGVFPYLYIPCEESNPEPKLAYQIANSIDKAINISLKQTNSETHHVYKIILVKAIPYYGYHKNHHQFYKIFLYNPLYVKRVAELLQSGAIMEKIYQPHEAHINYVMQFFIDFNIYGMSFINLEYVKYRRKPLKEDVNTSQNENDDLGNSNLIDQISVCELEADGLAEHILNKKDISNGNLGVNPGLEALWLDEKQRQEPDDSTSKLLPTPSQFRENTKGTDSHNFYKKKLMAKLAVNMDLSDINNDSEITYSTANKSELQETITNTKSSIYPAETPNGTDFLNASNVILHGSEFGKKTEIQKSDCSDYTVNETVISQYSQKNDQSQLTDADKELMAVLYDLEHVEDDSILGTPNDDNLDVEEENIIDDEKETQFSNEARKISEIEITTSCESTSGWNDSYWEGIENFSQLDGTWDDDKNSSKKSRKVLRVGLSKSCQISKRKRSNDMIESSVSVKINELNEKFCMFNKKFKSEFTKSPSKSPKKSPLKVNRNFDPLIVKTEELSPVKQNCSSQKNYVSKDSFQKATPKNSNVDSNVIKTSESISRIIESSEIVTNATKSPQVNEVTSTNILTASQYDRKNNFIPQAGSSKCGLENNIQEITQLHCLSNDDIESSDDHNIISFYNTFNYDSSKINETLNDSINPLSNTKLHETKNNSVCDDTDEDLKLVYIDTPKKVKRKENYFENNHLLQNYSRSKSLIKIVIPKYPPPSPQHIISTMDKYGIPNYKHTLPFYSNHTDVGKQVEVGNIVLKPKSINIDSLRDFPITVPGIMDLSSIREKLFIQNNMTQVHLDKVKLDVLLSNSRSCTLIPINKPPNLNSVKNWINKKMKQKISHNEINNSLLFEKHQLLIPSSPGQELSTSQMERLSLSSLSDVSSQEDQKSFSSTYTIKNSQEVKNDDNKSYELIFSNDNTIVPNNSCIILSPETSESDYIMCGQEYKNDSPHSAQEFPENIVTSIGPEQSIYEPSNTSHADSTLCNSKLSTNRPFKFSGENYQNARVHHDHEFLTVLTLEVHALTRGNLNPDPKIDPLCAVYYSIYFDSPETPSSPREKEGIILIEENNEIKLARLYPEINCNKYQIVRVTNETEIINEIQSLIMKWDPDILCGYEIEVSSWGYLFERANVLNINMASKISRVTIGNKHGYFKKDEFELDKEIKIIGRVMLNVWKLLRHEVALTSYSFENICYHVLHERIPAFSFKTLSFWWNHPSKLMRCNSIRYFLTRVSGTIRILLQLDLIGRTSELARLFGIQWLEVLSRGSQFRVESMMIRLARPFNYVLVSPSIQQRALMKAPECLPLILEPESRFYSDPIIVLDFQSLYPSMMIAYNYCYSTCLGKVDSMGKTVPFNFGASLLCVSPKLLNKLNACDMINWSPCGVGFVKPLIRKGILPKMLEDILNTRFMVKKSLKRNKENKTLKKVLHNRQLGLKLIANVTYGYTAANFSGRMPCVEVGDSVVSKGRETLERAIQMIEETPKWKARVVYGDTDSLFVLVPGRSKEEAFQIGAEIADAVTNDNPTPVKLKLEKVYQPCILQTKKRYVGYMYESPSQSSPEYDAKGIETVRRDGCPATAKLLEKTLKILFETCDISKVKSYVCQKFQNIIEGKCSIQDFIFAKEFRGMNAYKPTANIPALEIARRHKQLDHRREPREGERVPYVIVSTAPGQILLQSARCPRDLLADSSLRLNFNYYITRVIIPPLNRCLSLIGADVNQWFAQMPRKQLQSYPSLQNAANSENKKSTISQYFSKVNCAGCDLPTAEGLCRDCIAEPQKTALILNTKINAWKRKYTLTKNICQSCCGKSTQIECVSIDCPILFSLNNALRDTDQIPFILEMEKKLLEF